MIFSTEKPIVAATGISVSYGALRVLPGVSVNVSRSEIRVILGVSGCGKTTLLKTMVGLLRPTAGSVRLFDVEIGEQDDPATIAVLKKAGRAFSERRPARLAYRCGEHRTAAADAYRPAAAAIIAEIVAYKLAQVKLSGTGHLYPAELSGGMRKRAALARALALDPPLLFCDEPSAGLDPATAAGLDRLLLDLRRTLGITVVVVTHELRSIETIADNISFLHDGSVLFDGTLAEARNLTTGPVNEFFARAEPPPPAGKGGCRYGFIVERDA